MNDYRHAKTDNKYIAISANWKLSEDVIIPPASDYGTTEQRIKSKKECVYCLDWFIYFQKGII
ncbi:MAG: hypothetical protein ACLFMM_09555 [Methanohalobium sp.]|uniref:hypothetical protein n=1 Tax=Methanohalobium sp. TaxID=2837493 RepID=UPI00397DC4AC